MKIKMLNTAPGSENGYVVQDYEAGREYEVGDALGAAFVSAKQAEEVKASAPTPAPAEAADKSPAARKSK